jgi:aromatase
MSFEDSVRVNGPAELVYDFLYRVADWPQLVPHVSRLDLTEDQPGVQVMAMDTVTADGSTHTTESVRVCFPHAQRIVYKQTATPLLMSAHTGEWSVVPDETGVTVTSQHSVVLRPENIEPVLGPDADVQTARRYVREALGRNSGATLALAKKHAESAVRVL